MDTKKITTKHPKTIAEVKRAAKETLQPTFPERQLLLPTMQRTRGIDRDPAISFSRNTKSLRRIDQSAKTWNKCAAFYKN